MITSSKKTANVDITSTETSMTDTAAHIKDLKDILEAAKSAAKSNPTSANITAVQKAQKALEGYQLGSDEQGERFKTQSSALEYLQRTFKIEKSKLSKDVQDGRVPRKDGYFSAKDLDYYAHASRLESKNSEQTSHSEAKDRLTSAMASERELKLSQLRGELIDAAEEEARDARLWAAVKADIENHAPAIVHELINRILPIVEDDDLRQRILGMGQELRMTYEDAIYDIFDRYAKDGGIEA